MNPMTADTALYDVAGPDETGSIQHWLAIQMVENWAKAVEQFRRWEREEILRKEPSAKDMVKHRRASAWFIRATRHLQDVVMDPDFPLRERSEEIAGRLDQLESAFTAIHDPMTEEQADAILKQAFPDAPRTGEPH
jgi:hypothetical protein